MKTTRANVEGYVREQGWELVQIDGIPMGFSFKLPDVSVSGVLHKGGFIAFMPLFDWGHVNTVKGETEAELLEKYNNLKNAK